MFEVYPLWVSLEGVHSLLKPSARAHGFPRIE